MSDTFKKWADSKRIVPRTSIDKSTYQLMEIAWNASRVEAQARIKELESALEIALGCVDSDKYNQTLIDVKKEAR